MMKKFALFVTLGLVLGLLILPFSSIAAKRKAQKRVGIMTEINTGSVATNLGLYGGTTWDIEVDPSNNNYIYIATMYSPNGFFRSTDGGHTWSGLGTSVDYGSGQDVEVNPSNGHVFALLSGVYRSENRGQTFTKISSDASSILYAQNRLFMGTGNGEVKISTNEGNSFTTKTLDSGNGIVSIANTGNAIYAVARNYNGNNKVFKSTDAGANWTDLNVAAFGITEPERVIINPANSNVFLIPSSSESLSTYRSADGGSSWTALSASTPSSGFASFDSTGRMYMGWSYSDDGGNTWTSYRNLGSYSHYVAVDPTNNNILYDTTNGFAKSTDRGATWTEYLQGIVAVTATSVSQATDKNIVWVMTQNGLAKTTNFLSGSPDWQYPIVPVPSGTTFTSTGRDSVWVNPSNPNIVLAGSSAAIYRTTNGGSSWSAATVNMNLNGMVPRQIRSSGDDAAGIYAALGPSAEQTNTGGVVRSTDGGATWSSLSFPGGAAQSIDVAGDGDVFVGGGAGNGLYKYSSGSWSKLNIGDRTYASVLADPESPNTIYALATRTGYNNTDTGMGFYKSTNDGATWRHITNGLPSITNFYEFTALAIQRSTSPNSLYLGGVTSGDLKGVIYKSSDGGESWGLYYSGLKSETFHSLLFDGLVAGNDRGLYSIKSKASLGIAPYKRTVKKVKRKGKIRNKVSYGRLKTVKKGALVYLKVSLQDATTKKKLKKRTVLLYKKVIVKKKIKKKVRRVARWKLIKRLKISAKGYVLVRTKFNTSTIFYAKWKPANKNDKEEYTTSKSKSVKVKVAKAKRKK